MRRGAEGRSSGRSGERRWGLGWRSVVGNRRRDFNMPTRSGGAPTTSQIEMGVVDADNHTSTDDHTAPQAGTEAPQSDPTSRRRAWLHRRRAVLQTTTQPSVEEEEAERAARLPGCMFPPFPTLPLLHFQARCLMLTTVT